MGFLVGDRLSERHTKIRGFISAGEPEIGVLLAAADFEWVVRRAIIALGTSSNADIRKHSLGKGGGLKGYKDAWKKEVLKQFNKSLPEVVKDWDAFRKAYKLRNILIHGVAASTGPEYASSHIEIILSASSAVADFAKDQDIDLFQRLPVRRKERLSTERAKSLS